MQYLLHLCLIFVFHSSVWSSPPCCFASLIVEDPADGIELGPGRTVKMDTSKRALLIDGVEDIELNSASVLRQLAILNTTYQLYNASGLGVLDLLNSFDKFSFLYTEGTDSSLPVYNILKNAESIARLDPEDMTGGTTSLSDLVWTSDEGSAYQAIHSTQSIAFGKWYAEFQPLKNGGNKIGVTATGKMQNAVDGVHYPFLGGTAQSFAYDPSGVLMNNGVIKPYGVPYTNTDIVGVFLDLESSTLAFSVNGVYQGIAYENIPHAVYRFACDGHYGGGCAANFGGISNGHPPAKSTSFDAGLFVYNIADAFPDFRALPTINPSCNTSTTVFYGETIDQHYVLPDGCTHFSVKMWGAGGSNGLGGDHHAGSGGYTEAVITARAGSAFTIVVGEGGVRYNTDLNQWPYGGAGMPRWNSQNVGTGGGLTGIFYGHSHLYFDERGQTRAIAIAGGGGGLGDGPNGNIPYGGPGGGEVGVDGFHTTAGTGGTQDAGGVSAGNLGVALNGIPDYGSGPLRGASSGYNDNNEAATGGGGYFGGGSATNNNAPWTAAGGGSGYCLPNEGVVVGCRTEAKDVSGWDKINWQFAPKVPPHDDDYHYKLYWVNPANPSTQEYAARGASANGGGRSKGGDGLMVITPM